LYQGSFFPKKDEYWGELKVIRRALPNGQVSQHLISDDWLIALPRFNNP
jgi:hypothetical protein